MTDSQRRLVWMLISAGALIALALSAVLVGWPLYEQHRVTSGLRSPDAATREWALEQDERFFDDPDAFDGLVACVADADVGVRYAAGRLLYRLLSTRRAIPSGRNEAIRDAVLMAATAHEPSVDEGVWQRAILGLYLPPGLNLAGGVKACYAKHEGSPEARVRLVQLMGALLEKRPEMRDLLHHIMVNDPDSAVRVAALEAIAEDESRSARERIAELTRALPSLPSDEALRGAVRELMRKLGRDFVGEEAKSWSDWLKKKVGGD